MFESRVLEPFHYYAVPALKIKKSLEKLFVKNPPTVLSTIYCTVYCTIGSNDLFYFLDCDCISNRFGKLNKF
jgi:hypothetical protein